jgi:hypothetical protein
MRRMFKTKREEVTVEWRRIHIEELQVMTCRVSIKSIPDCKHLLQEKTTWKTKGARVEV